MAEGVSPITHQISKETRNVWTPPVDFHLQEVEDCLIHDRHGVSAPFKTLYQDRKSVIIFVRVGNSFVCLNFADVTCALVKVMEDVLVKVFIEKLPGGHQNFLCYSCKEYVDDLSKIPKEVLEEAQIRLVIIGQSAHHHIEPFCALTGYPFEIYVDPERCIYQKLGMKKEERYTETACPSPHVKSGMFMGQLKSIWRAMTSPAFDFQGDLHQQGGAIIAGPGSEVHFCHFDMNRLDHMPINWLLQLAGVHQTLDFSDKPKILHV